MSWLLLPCRGGCKLFFFSKSASTNWGEDGKHQFSSVFHKALISLCSSYAPFSFTVLEYLIFLVLRNNASKKCNSNFIF